MYRKEIVIDITNITNAGLLTVYEAHQNTDIHLIGINTHYITPTYYQFITKPTKKYDNRNILDLVVKSNNNIYVHLGIAYCRHYDFYRKLPNHILLCYPYYNFYRVMYNAYHAKLTRKTHPNINTYKFTNEMAIVNTKNGPWGGWGTNHISSKEFYPMEACQYIGDWVVNEIEDQIVLDGETVLRLLLGRPFITVGPRYFHKTLKHLGFKLYQYINYQFDCRPNNQDYESFFATMFIIDHLHSIHLYRRHCRKQFWKTLASIASFNSNQFLKIVTDKETFPYKPLSMLGDTKELDKYKDVISDFPDYYHTVFPYKFNVKNINLR